jgi:putative hydrolase of the HAD superfamily
MKRRPPKALLIDFDGVLRVYDRDPGPFLQAGLEWSRYIPAVTGAWTRAQWLDSIAEATGADRDEVTEWDSYRGRIDRTVLEFVREVRAGGKTVALTTNATSDLREDLARFGLDADFDHVFSSAEIGWRKPSREYFTTVLEQLRLPAGECLLVDDTARNVAGARAAGLLAMRWTGLGDLGYLRAALLAG